MKLNPPPLTPVNKGSTEKRKTEVFFLFLFPWYGSTFLSKKSSQGDMSVNSIKRKQGIRRTKDKVIWNICIQPIKLSVNFDMICK
jgi:hypothetical protein